LDCGGKRSATPLSRVQSSRLLRAIWRARKRRRRYAGVAEWSPRRCEKIAEKSETPECAPWQSILCDSVFRNFQFSHSFSATIATKTRIGRQLII
jgi:hypothetical protein